MFNLINSNYINRLNNFFLCQLSVFIFVKSCISESILSANGRKVQPILPYHQHLSVTLWGKIKKTKDINFGVIILPVQYADSCSSSVKMHIDAGY